MKTIYKYELINTPVQTIQMPEGSKILTVQLQGKTPVLWALIDTKKKNKRKTIELYHTGSEIRGGAAIMRDYIGTFQTRESVFHVFEYKGM